jgi:putative membrane protein insertion efficiency factor
MQWLLQFAGRQGLVEFLLNLYKRLLSPLFGNSCRFSPSCSEYAAQAVIQHGWIRGSGLAAKRVFRCHPFGASGYDPVPHCSHSEQLRS